MTTFMQKNNAAQWEKGYNVVNRYVNGFEVYKDNGYGLIITSPDDENRRRLTSVVETQLTGREVTFISRTQSALFEELAGAFDNEQQIELMKAYTGVELLVLRDIGSLQPSLEQIETLFNIICARYEALLPTVITTGFSLEELASQLKPFGSDGSMERAIIRRLRDANIELAA